MYHKSSILSYKTFVKDSLLTKVLLVLIYTQQQQCFHHST